MGKTAFDPPEQKTGRKKLGPRQIGGSQFRLIKIFVGLCPETRRSFVVGVRSKEKWRETMRKLIAITQVTLDGVMQSPGGPEEDPRNGFAHGGWAVPFLDDALFQALGETIAGEFDMLLGRRTYEIFAAYWPNHGDNPIGTG